MKIEKTSTTDYKIILLNPIEDIKKILKRLQKILRLKGFYQVIVISKKYGTFLQLIRLEDSLYQNTVDFKVEEKDEDIYFETDDYFLLLNSSCIYYRNELFYGLVEEDFEIFQKSEFGTFLFGKEVLSKIKNSILVKGC